MTSPLLHAGQRLASRDGRATPQASTPTLTRLTAYADGARRDSSRPTSAVGETSLPRFDAGARRLSTQSFGFADDFGGGVRGGSAGGVALRGETYQRQGSGSRPGEHGARSTAAAGGRVSPAHNATFDQLERLGDESVYRRRAEALHGPVAVTETEEELRARLASGRTVASVHEQQVQHQAQQQQLRRLATPPLTSASAAPASTAPSGGSGGAAPAGAAAATTGGRGAPPRPGLMWDQLRGYTDERVMVDRTHRHSAVAHYGGAPTNVPKR